MRVIVLGAGGRLGSQVLAAAVRAGHQSTAFVRSAERLRAAVGSELLKQVTVVEGDVSDADALSAAMAGHEACIQVGGWAAACGSPCAGALALADGVWGTPRHSVPARRR